MERKHVAEKIETLIRQKKMGDDQLMHLMWLFAQEENIKITRSQTRRLLRLEKYSEETIKKVIDFLSEVEKYPVAKNLQQTGAAAATNTNNPTNVPKGYINENVAEQEMKKRKVVAQLRQRVQQQSQTGLRLPKARPEEENGQQLSQTAFSDALVLSGWLVQQMKFTKAAKKIKPTLAAPIGTATALPISVRVVPKKKKRKPRKKSAAPKKRKEDEEQQEEEEEEPLVAPEDEPPHPDENADEEPKANEEEEEAEDAPVGFEMEKEEEEEEEGEGEVESEPSDDEEEEEDGDDENDEEDEEDEEVGGNSKKKPRDDSDVDINSSE